MAESCYERFAISSRLWAEWEVQGSKLKGVVMEGCSGELPPIPQKGWGTTYVVSFSPAGEPSNVHHWSACQSSHWWHLPVRATRAECLSHCFPPQSECNTTPFRHNTLVGKLFLWYLFSTCFVSWVVISILSTHLSIHFMPPINLWDVIRLAQYQPFKLFEQPIQGE